MAKTNTNTTRFKGDITNLNIVVTVFAVIANFAVLFTLFNATKFSNLSGKTFIIVNVLSIILLIAMNIALMVGIRTKTKPVYFTGSIAGGSIPVYWCLWCLCHGSCKQERK